jgi:hypothetical protein
VVIGVVAVSVEEDSLVSAAPVPEVLSEWELLLSVPPDWELLFACVLVLEEGVRRRARAGSWPSASTTKINSQLAMNTHTAVSATVRRIRLVRAR